MISGSPTQLSLASRIPDYLKRCFWACGAAIALSLGLVATPLGTAIELTLGDQVARLVAQEQDFSDVVVIDVDELSMANLSSQIGAWPYDRDVFALTNAYLLASGARVVAFDILFSEARRGDDDFAKTLSGKNALASAALPYGGAVHDDNYRNQLAAAAWAKGPDWPAQTWQDLTLPRELFSSRAPVGVITMGADADGVVRRIPLLHQAYGEVLPALTALVLKIDGVAVELDKTSHQLRVANEVLPMDAEGMVHLRYPKNWRIQVVSFYELALAASGSARYAKLAETVRGKTVYIGSSSAILGDFAQTPLGRLAGLYIAAALPTMVKQGHLYKPRYWPIDAALILMLLAFTCAAAHPKVGDGIWLQAGMFPVVILATLAVAALVHASGQKTAFLLPLLTSLLAQFFLVIWRQVWLFRRNQRLQVEKLAAEESNRLKGQFLAHMTHELRTPLTAILGFNNINWKSETLTREERIGNGEVIDRNSRHLLALINSILDQAKLEAGQIRIVKQPENLRALVNDVMATMLPLVSGKPVTLEAVFDEQVPEVVEIDAFRIRQILLNLLSNAVKFTSKGSVKVVVSWEPGQVSMKVIDTGPGMSAEQLNRIFVPFQQANDTDAARFGGTGLGLTISKELASLMGGNIGVESSVGVGTRFLLNIPAAASPEAALSVQEDMRPVAIGPKLMNGVVMIAEDADDLRGLAVIYLKRFGLSVLQAKNGREAVDLALEHVPDVVLMDMEMPVLHGLEAVRELRGAGFGRPILAMTAHGGEPHRTLALAAGCNDVLPKPVSQAVLRAALDSALSATRKALPP